MAFGEGGCASHPHAGELVSRTRSPLPKSGVTRRRWQGATTRNSWRYSEEEQRSQRRRDAPEFGDGLRIRDTSYAPPGRTSASRGRSGHGEPTMRGEEAPQAQIVRGERRQPLVEQRSLPPGAARVAGRRELVAVAAGADGARGRVGEGVVGEEAERPPVVVEELPHQVERPGVALRSRRGGE